MTVYVLYHHFDTPDVDGNEIIGVYRNIEDARTDMLLGVAAIQSEFPDNFWDDDMTWYEDDEIHLGAEKPGDMLATIYCWEIVSMEVQ